MLVVLGSINADLVFRVKSLPRPGETVLCAGFAFHHGGKGANQAAAAARSGGKVRFVGRIGEDSWGALLRRGLEDAGVDTSLLETSPRSSGIAAIAVDESGENAIVVASGANLDVTAEQLDRAGLTSADTLLCQNEIPLAVTREALERARGAGARTILNCAPATSGANALLDLVDVLVVNHGEACALLERDLPPEPAARALASERRSCVLTLGRQGALAVGLRGPGTSPPCRCGRSTPPVRATPSPVCWRRASISACPGWRRSRAQAWQLASPARGRGPAADNRPAPRSPRIEISYRPSSRSLRVERRQTSGRRSHRGARTEPAP